MMVVFHQYKTICMTIVCIFSLLGDNGMVNIAMQKNLQQTAGV
jgi:hypothetical protein